MATGRYGSLGWEPPLPPEYMKHLLLRPETFASQRNVATLPNEVRPKQLEIVKHLAPGDVIVKAWGFITFGGHRCAPARNS